MSLPPSKKEPLSKEEFLKARMQAALYSNKKRRKKRLAEQQT